MRIALAVAALTVATAVPVRAQTEEGAAMAVVTKLFDGMRARDTALMRSMLAPEARLLGVDDQGKLQVIDPSRWIGGVGRGEGPGPDERTFDPVVHVDGNIAQVWVYYELWVGPRLSHCGYDAFFLAKLAEGWKVAQVADTRRTDCTPRK